MDSILPQNGVSGKPGTVQRNAEIVAQLAVAKIQLATMSRANVPPKARRRFYLYLDEFPSLVGSDAAAYETLLVRARKYRVCLTLAAQHTGMLPESLLKTILGNVGTLVSFSTGSEDARRLGREFSQRKDAIESQLLNLGVGEAFCKFDRLVVPLRMLPPPKGGSLAVRNQAIRRSRERYGSEPAAPRRPAEPSLTIDTIDPSNVF